MPDVALPPFYLDDPSFSHSLYRPLAWHAPPQNPYPIVHPPPPPQIAHKVFILDCASCGTFLTNRGMKAVLLLRPDISLYSTDAFPINCSAQSNSDISRSSASRTCECLTQTIACHGCGSSVGYMIVIPCVRCTSSISATNRATNGHRFVFHAGEVVGSERHYIPNEAGVIPFDTLSQPSPSIAQHQDSQDYMHRQAGAPHLAPAEVASTSLSSPDLSPASSISSLPELSPASDSDYFPVSSPHQRIDASMHFSRRPQFTTHAQTYRPYQPTPSYLAHSFAPHNWQPDHGQDREQKMVESQDPSILSRRPLRPGDVLHWHNLSRNGEIPGVKEDARARQKGTNAVVWCCR